jgi:hypothetical protein
MLLDVQTKASHIRLGRDWIGPLKVPVFHAHPCSPRERRRSISSGQGPIRHKFSKNFLKA